MTEADGWYMCRIGFVETMRAVGLAAGPLPVKAIQEEWPAFGVIELDQALVEHAAELAINRNLRSLDSIHLAAALLVPAPDMILATWDQRLHAAAAAEGLQLLPNSLP
jgi:predicted nucleic acid-binding protein